MEKKQSLWDWCVEQEKEQVLQEWDDSKNEALDIHTVRAGSHKKAHWICPIGHEYETSIRHRTMKGSKCPYCINRRVLAGYNDFETKFPSLAKEWHPTKNGEVKPSDILGSTSQKFWWTCKIGHAFHTTVLLRTHGGTGCPYCSNKKVLFGYNDLQTRFPDLAKEWHPTKNGEIKPSDLMPGSLKNVWWLCPLEHPYQTKVCTRAFGGSGCPYCANRSVLIGYNDVQTTHPDLVKEWHPTKNGAIKPTDITAGNRKVHWWKCAVGHTYDMSISVKSRNKTGCPVCSHRRVLTGYNDLQTTHPDVAKEWHPTKNGDITPDKVIAGGVNKHFWWLCQTCGEEWKATISDRKGNRGCPSCASLKRVQTRRISHLATTDNLTMTHPDLCKEWHPTKNGVWEPESYSKGSNKKAWWLCGVCGHEYYSVIVQRAKGVGCPKCALQKQTSFQEKTLYYYLRDTFNQVIPNYKIKGLGKSEVDIYIPELKLAIEYDGEAWHQDIEKDKKKNKYCLENGLTLIRIREPDCPVLDDSSIDFTLPSCKDADLRFAVDFVVDYVNKTYQTQVSIDFDMERDRSAILDMMDLQGKEKSLALLNPKLASEWHPTLNKSLTPSNITAGSNKKVWWQCEKGHSYADSVTHRNDNRNCPFCSGRRILEGFNDLASVNPTLANEWHPNKNEPLKPTEVTISKGIKVWWQCSTCSHEWEALISSRTSGVGCPICGIKKSRDSRLRNKANNREG